MADTGKLGVADSILNKSHILASGASVVDVTVKEASASSPINVTHASDKRTSILTVGAETDINIAQSAENNYIDLSAENTLALTQDESVIVAGPIDEDATSVLSLTSTSDFTFGAFGRLATNDLNIGGTNGDGTVDTNIKNLETLSPISLSQDMRLVDTFEVTTSSAITVSQEAPQPTGKRSVAADSTINLLQFADHKLKKRDVESSIVLSQGATVEKILTAGSILSITDIADEGFVNLLADNTIVFDQTASPGAILLDVASTINLSDSVISNIRMLGANNDIEVTHSNNVLRPYRVDAENKISGITDDIFVPPVGPIIPGIPFGLSQEATQGFDPTRDVTTLIQVANQAEVVQILNNATALAANTNIGISQFANTSLVADGDNIITLIDFAVVSLNTTDASTLIDTVEQSANFSILYGNLSLSDRIELKQAVAYSLVRDTTDCDYSPFVSDSDSDTTPPRLTLPEPKVPELPGIRFRLVYPPFDKGETVDTLDLRAPDFGNRERLEATRIQRESVGGTLNIFADLMWPKVHTLQMQFSALSEIQAHGLLAFTERWVGQEIGIYDYEQRIWKGIITNPQEAVIQDGRCNYSATLEIEAQRVHQLNRTTLSNLGLGDVAGQDEYLALSAITADHSTDYSLFPVAPGNSAIDLTSLTDYTKVPALHGASTIAPTQFASRNSFFYESANSSISLNDLSDSIDFDSFGNLVHNWDAENTTGTSSGNPLSTWSDLGGSPVQLNANSVSNEPTARDGILNGHRVIEFRHSAASQHMLSASNAPLWHLLNNTGTIFIVTIIRETLTGGNEVILGNTTDKIMLGGTTATERPVALQSSEGTVTLETPQSVLASGSTQLLMIKRNGNNVAFRRNNTDEDGTTLSTNPTAGNETLFFGGFGGAGNSVDQDIAQVLVYDDVLNVNDILTIESLLSVKWGI
ncbi:MAG: hypothetical protein ACW987_14005 [Candidatus Thorarchaeota archaeon]|jgi:hypothetical protein